MDATIKVLVVDDSHFMRRVIREILELDAQLKVVGTSSNGADCLQKIKLLKPDVVTLDIDMPGMSGMSVIRHIMIQSPVPIVVFSSMYCYGDVTFEALQLGVVDFVPKPSGLIFEGRDRLHSMIIDRVKNASGVNLDNIRRADIRPRKNRRRKYFHVDRPGLKKLIAVGAGLSGTNSVIRLMANLSPRLSCAMVAVLEIAPQILPAFVQKFDRCVPWRIALAEDGQSIEPGVCYLGSHKDGIRVVRDRHGAPCFTKNEEVANPLDVLFASSADIFQDNAAGVLLNGLGGDGGEGLLKIKAYRGVTITIPTDSCVFPNLTQNAINNGAVTRIVDENRLHEAIEELFSPKKRVKTKQYNGATCDVTLHVTLPAIALQSGVNAFAAYDLQNHLTGLRFQEHPISPIANA